jgi:hypothetical protein
VLEFFLDLFHNLTGNIISIINDVSVDNEASTSILKISISNLSVSKRLFICLGRDFA